MLRYYCSRCRKEIKEHGLVLNVPIAAELRAVGKENLKTFTTLAVCESCRDELWDLIANKFGKMVLCEGGPRYVVKPPTANKENTEDKNGAHFMTKGFQELVDHLRSQEAALSPDAKEAYFRLASLVNAAKQKNRDVSLVDLNALPGHIVWSGAEDVAYLLDGDERAEDFSEEELDRFCEEVAEATDWEALVERCTVAGNEFLQDTIDSIFRVSGKEE